jgi:hypothetical protein
MHNALVVVSFALVDQRPGDGGFGVIPGESSPTQVLRLAAWYSDRDLFGSTKAIHGILHGAIDDQARTKAICVVLWTLYTATLQRMRQRLPAAIMDSLRASRRR